MRIRVDGKYYSIGRRDPFPAGKEALGRDLDLCRGNITGEWDRVTLYRSQFEDCAIVDAHIREFTCDVDSPHDSLIYDEWEGRSHWHTFTKEYMGTSHFDHVILTSLVENIDQVWHFASTIGIDRIGAITAPNLRIFEIFRPDVYKWAEPVRPLLFKGLELYGLGKEQLEYWLADPRINEDWILQVDEWGMIPMTLKTGILPLELVTPEAFAKVSAPAKVALLEAGYHDTTFEDLYKEVFGEG